LSSLKQPDVDYSIWLFIFWWSDWKGEFDSQYSQFLHNLHIYPLNWLADVREAGAELTFCVGGKLAQRR